MYTIKLLLMFILMLLVSYFLAGTAWWISANFDNSTAFETSVGLWILSIINLFRWPKYKPTKSVIKVNE